MKPWTVKYHHDCWIVLREGEGWPFIHLDFNRMSDALNYCRSLNNLESKLKGIIQP